MLEILYEDTEVIVVNKSAGLVVHHDGRTKEVTLADLIIKKYPSIYGVGETITLANGGIIEKWGIVHRLDRDTSGVILIAKTQESFLNLKAQFQVRIIQKSYRAIAYGWFKEEHGCINKPIGRSTSDFRKWSAEYGARGNLREAVTNYDVLGNNEQWIIDNEKDAEILKVSYLNVSPKTGRTHQIRVHLKAIGHPILCDILYAPKYSCPLFFGRTALHAFSIKFRNLSGIENYVEAPLTSDFIHALAVLHVIHK